MKKVRAAAVVAVVTTAASRAREYAREHPDEAGQAVERVEAFLQGRLSPGSAAWVGKGGTALRSGLGLAPRGATSATGTTSATGPSGDAGSGGLTDPDPDTTEPVAAHAFGDPVAPNPSPGTSDDPQPRRQDDEPAPLTPGERHRP